MTKAVQLLALSLGLPLTFVARAQTPPPAILTALFAPQTLTLQVIPQIPTTPGARVLLQEADTAGAWVDRLDVAQISDGSGRFVTGIVIVLPRPVDDRYLARLVEEPTTPPIAAPTSTPTP